MATTINKAGADTYFDEKNHVDHAKWAAFDDDQRTAAVTQATRIITRALGSAVGSETVDTDASYQPDYAVYEQALYMLIHSDIMPNGEETAPHWAGSGDDGAAVDALNPLSICPEARKWMDWQYGPTIPIFRG